MGSQPYSIGRILANFRSLVLGKLLSAPLTFALLIMLASWMPRKDYAAYIAATALLEIGVWVGTCGIDWLMQTVIARIRVHGSAAALRRAAVVLGIVQFVPYGLLAAGGWLFAPQLSALLSGVASVEVIRLYAIVLAIEGPTRMLRDNLMAVLLMQGGVQIAQIARVVAMFAGVAILPMLGGQVEAIDVAHAEIAASSISALLVVCYIARYLWNERGSAHGDADIRPYFGRDAFRLALHAYLSFMLTLTMGGDLITALVARFLGTDATALYGFVSRLIDAGRRFLPMDLFYAILRPATIGRFEVSGGDRKVLIRDGNLMLRANLLVLGAATATAIAAGQALVPFLSRGSVHAEEAFIAAALLLPLWNHTLRRVVELVAFIIGRSRAFLNGAWACALAPIFLFVALPATRSLYTVPATLVVVDLLFTAIVIRQLRDELPRSSFDWRTGARILLAALASGLAAMPVARSIDGLAGILLGTIVACTVYVAVLFVVGAVNAAQVRDVMDLARRKFRPEVKDSTGLR